MYAIALVDTNPTHYPLYPICVDIIIANKEFTVINVQGCNTLCRWQLQYTCLDTSV